MARQATFPLYDRILDGKLNDLLRSLTANGAKAAEVRDILRDEHEVTVSVETVRRWIQALEKGTAA